MQSFIHIFIYNFLVFLPHPDLFYESVLLYVAEMLNFVYFFSCPFLEKVLEDLRCQLIFPFFKKIEVCSESPKCFSSFRRIQEENWLSNQITLFMMSSCLYVVA